MPEGQWRILQFEHTASNTHEPTNLCISLICQGKASIQKRCSLQINKASKISTPIAIAPNVWIIASPTAAVPSGITVICPGEVPRSVIPQTPIQVLWLQPTCNTTSKRLHLPPCYESHKIPINITLNTANLNVINISALKFGIWQHLEDHWNRTLLQHLVNIPSVPIEKLYKQMVSSNGPITPFMSTDESIGETVSVWKLFPHAGVYIMAIGSLIPAGLGKFCCYFFWCQPDRLVCQPLQWGPHDILLWMII